MLKSEDHGSFTILFVLTVTILSILHMAWALAAEPEPHPAFGQHHLTNVRVESSVPDIKKLEDKAVTILREKYGLTLEEARAKVRIEGKTDVALCLEFVFINALVAVAQAEVSVVTVENAHP